MKSIIKSDNKSLRIRPQSPQSYLFRFSATLLSAIAMVPIANAPALVQAQAMAPGGPGQRSTTIIGEIERVGPQFQLVLTNQSDEQAFQGAASVGVVSSASVPIQIVVTLAPGETRRIPLALSASTNDQYSLKLMTQTGVLVLYKISTIKASVGSDRKSIPGRAATSPKDGSSKEPLDLKVSARLTRGLASRNAELPTVDTDEPFLLTLEIESPAPMKNASLTLEGRDFQRRQDITMQARAELEFKLPETLRERKLHYALTTEAGRRLASGEIDLDQLTAAESVSVGALTFDRPTYAPGESARAVFEIQGDASNGYRLEVTAKDGEGNLLLKTERRGSNSAGKSRQEFLLEIPREAKGPIILAYQVFGGQTGSLFDSGERGIILQDAQVEKASAGKRLSP
jgi:hypothetical protein